MKNTFKKITSVLISAAAVSSMLTATLVVNAANSNSTETVRVIVENNVFPADCGAPWDGILVDKEIELTADTTMISAISDAVKMSDYSISGAEMGYITEINGLEEYGYEEDGVEYGGWMGTLNDWFTSNMFSYYTVADGTLKDGDEIRLQYTLFWGEDIGSSWSNNDTTLMNLEFSAGELSEDFDSETSEYTLTIPSDCDSLNIYSTATNKNFQVRHYKTNCTPDIEGSEINKYKPVAVADGDVFYIYVGYSSWDTMNISDGGHYYTVNVVTEKPANDVNGDGVFNVNDITYMQRAISGDVTLTDEQLAMADFNKDGNFNVFDVTFAQRMISED